MTVGEILAPLESGPPPDDVVLDVRGLRTQLSTSRGANWIQIIRDVSFTLRRNQRLAIVGESGSGKSVTALSIMRLLDKSASEITGEVWIGGEDAQAMSDRQMRRIRGRRVAMIFQDPMTSLNPVKRIGDQIVAAMRLHSDISQKDAMAEALRLLKEVQIPAPEQRLRSYPHELSGGMRQRVMIALALSMEPEVIIADEPTTALDVTVQAQVMRLLKERVESHGAATILITHDLGLVAGFAEFVLVMYAGRIVERGPIERVLLDPAHPYTAGLLASLCTLDTDPLEELPSIEGAPPRPDDVPSGCSFHPRCWMATDLCRTERPPMVEGASPDLGAAECHFAWNVVPPGAGT
ncbi:ABC transporter ATP-binding protein [bacterium]|nr:ABC transporter ATP-binding protein [bacterium]